MNPVQILSSQAWVERLGWTLIHFLWQGLAIAALYAAVRRGLARASAPHIAYLLACAALAAMLAAPVVTWELLGPSHPSAETAFRIQDSPPAASATDGAITRTASPVSIATAIASRQAAHFLPWVVTIWLCGAILCWARLAGGWVVAARLRSRLVRRAPPEWQERLASLGARIGVRRPVSLLVSALVEAPTVVGWLRPVVLVPVGALGGLPAEHLEALLLHELAHIRRLDYLVNMLQSVAEALLFYHPAVWWVSGHIRVEREQCCDDVAVGVTGDAFTYARALAHLESCRPAEPVAALAATGGSLSGRIARLLGQTRPSGTGLGPGVFALTILLLAAAYGLFGQSGAHPAFEVASIKRTPAASSDPHSSPMGGGFQPGGRLHMTNCSLVLLIQFAYAPHDSPHWLPLLASQVVGASGWMHTDGYDIDAKPAEKTDPKDTWLMLQTLLADRFQLALHRETRELPAYTLTVAKSGPKLPAAKDAGCVSFPPGTQPHFVPGKVDCGYVSGGMGGLEGGPMRIQGRKVHVADLVRELASMLDSPVLDKTGFTGEFDLNLTFTPDELLRGFPVHGPTDPNTPNILAALEEQLGLKLVAGRGPVEVLVVDHAERPTPN